MGLQSQDVEASLPGERLIHSDLPRIVPMTGARSQSGETAVVHPYDPLRFHGVLVWLTEEQGGRRKGPPRPAPGRDYAATGFVPPLTVETGLASLVVRPATPGAWRSTADAGWLVGDYKYPHDVVPGDVIVVTEGPSVVGYFHVQSLR